MTNLDTQPHPTLHLPIIQLPTEIWLKIFFYTHAPKPLSQTSKSLYKLTKTSLTVSQWLVFQYGRDAVYAAVWYWCRNVHWRTWISLRSMNPKLEGMSKRIPVQSVSKLSEKMHKEWFSESVVCRECNGYGLFDDLDMNQTLNAESIIEILQDTLKRDCKAEKRQWEVISKIMSVSKLTKPTVSVLIRFAASSGHPKLLRSLSMLDPVWSDTIEEMELSELAISPLKHVLYQSLKTRNIMFTYICLSTTILSRSGVGTWGLFFSAAVDSTSAVQTCLFLHEDPQTTHHHILYALRTSNYPWPPETKKRTRLVALMALKTLDVGSLRENEQVIVTAVCETGDCALIRYLCSMNVNFGFLDGFPLYVCILNGYIPAANILLKEARVNPNVLTSNRIVLIAVLVLDHLIMAYATISTLAACINSVVCLSYGLAGTISLFGIQDGDGWCMAFTAGTPEWWQLLIILVVFVLIWILLFWFIPIVSILKCVVLVLRRCRASRRVSPDLEMGAVRPYTSGSEALRRLPEPIVVHIHRDSTTQPQIIGSRLIASP